MKKSISCFIGFFLFCFVLSACNFQLPGEVILPTDSSEPATLPISSPQPELPTTEPESTSQPAVGYATFQGYIGYPSEGWCPEMTLYARSSTGEQSIYSWNDGQCYFSFTVQAPATYILFAWAGGEYSDFGFMVTDDEYSAKEITISVDEVVSGITLISCATAYVPTP